jgi:hypothetical protein
MNTTSLAAPSWSTTTFGDAAAASWSQVAAMGEHLDLCKAMSGPLFAMHCSAEAVHAFAATRFVTTLMIIVLLLAAGSSIL